ncbi:hypothetical protein [Nitrosovibrio tenuis]|uniref:Uncharacterized protein n=1 Tax=Nitrosovibrio tenuis TaxID=1233 RepID=A0A1H7IS89_9PROT|nr:hypothetical protein [Nitrosovibrio tenuis]SEK64480.1 hypothetical protein SAMN05216387_102258 [Nitrosovibrio tenuis]
MPKSVWEKAGDEARAKIGQAADYVVDTSKNVDARMEGGADSLLDKLKSSRWTSAILIAAAVIVIVVLASLF